MADAPRLYVGNLLYQVQPGEVASHFASHGLQMRNIDMSIDPFTGRNPSYCFVDFPSQEDAALAMQTLQGTSIRGRPLKINVRTEKRSKSRIPTRGYEGGWRARDQSAQTKNPLPRVYDRWNRTDARDHWTAPTDEGRRLCVGGLPKNYPQDDLDADMRALFKDWTILAVSRLIWKRDEPREMHQDSDRYCFVDFQNAEDARRAQSQLNGTLASHGSAYEIRIAGIRSTQKVRREQLEACAAMSSGEEPRKRPRRDFDHSWRARG